MQKEDLVTPAIDLRHVSKRFNEREVLRDANLKVNAGEIAVIEGESGSGKSTLLSLVGGLDGRYRGSVEVLGRVLGDLDDVALSRMRNREIAFVFQRFQLIPRYSTLENIMLPARFSAQNYWNSKDLRSRGEELSTLVGLAEFADQKVCELSGGQQQRVAIARALLHHPALMLCDEATGNLDAKTGAEILELFRQINREEGCAMLIVTHESRVSEIADRCYRLEAGGLREIGPS